MTYVAWFRVFYGVIAVIVIGVELYAVFDKTAGNTISETVWQIQKSGMGKFIRFMLAAFLLWLAVHFATGGKWWA